MNNGPSSIIAFHSLLKTKGTALGKVKDFKNLELYVKLFQSKKASFTEHFER